MTDQQRADLLRWAEALESGKYKQTECALRRGNGDFYCCLGVAVEIGIAKEDDGENVKDFCGFETNDITAFVKANDDWNLTFDQIATAIRWYLDDASVGIEHNLAFVLNQRHKHIDELRSQQ